MKKKGKRLSLLARAMLMLADITDAEIKSIETDKGPLFLIDADEPDVDVEVFVQDEDGMRVMPENGDYIYESFRLTITNGVITAKVDTTAEEDLEEKPEKGKLSKLELDADLPTVINTLNLLIEAVGEISDEVDNLGGNTDDVPVIEELKEIKKDISGLSAITAKTVEALAALGEKSNGQFVKPNPEDLPKAKAAPSTKEIINHYKK